MSPNTSDYLRLHISSIQSLSQLANESPNPYRNVQPVAVILPQPVRAHVSGTLHMVAPDSDGGWGGKPSRRLSVVSRAGCS